MPPATTASGSVRMTSTRLLAFMFTDLVDSSQLARQMGDQAYVEQVLEPHNAIFRRLLKQFPEAREVKHTGDGFMATFSRASEAAQLALEFHQELASAAWPGAAPTTRIGINLGEAIGFSSSDGTPTDLAGDTANMTARLMGLAEPGQTLLTKAAFDSARQSGRVVAKSGELRWLDHGHYELKGADEPIQVCEVGVVGVSPLRPPSDRGKGKRLSSADGRRTQEYDVFLSSHPGDAAAVRQICGQLEKRGLKICLENDTPGGSGSRQTSDDAFPKAMADIPACLIVVGPQGFDDNQKSEITAARLLHKKGRAYAIVPILLPGVREIPADYAFLGRFNPFRFAVSVDEAQILDRLAAVLKHESAPATGGPRPDDECPYRGLERFEIEHAAVFFGRDDLTRTLLERVATSLARPGRRFLAIEGASGSGKSSLSRAGLLARLKNGDLEHSATWPQVVIIPGDDPLHRLAIEVGRVLGQATASVLALKSSLAASDQALKTHLDLHLAGAPRETRCVLLVDQFEELYVACKDAAVRKAFIDNLLRASEGDRALVVVAVRADFIGKCAAHSELARAMSDNCLLVGPMTEPEMREVIERPADMRHSLFDPGLVDQLLGEMEKQPGNLPLLQFALKELWQKRDGNRLTLEAYHYIGGVQGALEKHAERIYAQYTDQQKKIWHRLFLRLTNPGEGTEATRRRVSLADLLPAQGSSDEVTDIIWKLSEWETRLITVNKPGDQADEFVEVAHEALIRGWTRLRQWIDADRAGMVALRQLSDAAHLWKEKNKNPDYLLQGARLAATEEFVRDHCEQLNALENEFVGASRQDAKRRRRGKWVAVGAVVVLLAMTLFLLVNHYRVSQSHALQARVHALTVSPAGDVPERLKDLASAGSSVVPLLESEADDPRLGPVVRNRLEVALLSHDAGRLDSVKKALLTAEVDEIGYLVSGLSPHRESVVPFFRQIAHDDRVQAARRLRACCVLAAFAPDDSDWDKLAPFVAKQLVRQNPLTLRQWAKYFLPVSDTVTADLRSIGEGQQEERFLATDLILNWSDRAARRAALVPYSDPRQFEEILAQLETEPKESLMTLRSILESPSKKAENEADKDSDAHRRAKAAIAMIRLGAGDEVWPLFRHSPDPRLRTFLIHDAGPLGVPADTLLARFRVEKDVSARRALVLALGEYKPYLDSLAATDRTKLVDEFLAVYQNDPDGGIHSAAEWVLGQWGAAKDVQAIDRKLAGVVSPQKNWFISPQGLTFVKIDTPGEWTMGSPDDEYRRQKNEEILHTRRIGRSFYISTKEVTIGQFRAYDPKYTYNEAYAGDDPAAPAMSVSWYQAAGYCRWLSEHSDPRQACFPGKDQIKEGMTLAADCLDKEGFRLPTEAEWEYCCRAGAATVRPYGASSELLKKYAWHIFNADDKVTPVGQLRPNDFGLFDILGNTGEWCLDAKRPYPVTPGKVVDDVLTDEVIKDTQDRVVRGGAFYDQPSMLRAARRYSYAPTDTKDAIGFRVVKGVR